MPTNVYFDTGSVEEKRLYEDLVIEQLKVFGQDVYYLPSTLVAEDTVFGVDALSKFDDAYMIEMYFENTDGFAGDKEIMSQFGLENQEEAVFIVSQRRFEDLIVPDLRQKCTRAAKVTVTKTLYKTLFLKGGNTFLHHKNSKFSPAAG